MLSRRYSFEVLGPISVVLAVLVALRFLFGVSGVPQAPVSAIIGTVLFVVAWILLRNRARRQKFQKVRDLRGTLHELEEQEFSLRYEEAKKSGQLDRWETKE